MGSLKALLADVRQALTPRRLWRALVALQQEDVWVARIILAFACIECVLISWDQPGAVSWENDGVAPRDLFRGVVNNLIPGSGHRYPLFHNLILLLLNAPVVLVSAVVAGILHKSITSTLFSVPSMTVVSLTSKLLHVAMGSVMLLALARISRQLFGVVAGRACALTASACLTIEYYARVSNLDGPYMFWQVLAVACFLRVIERGRLEDYRLLGCLVAASIATKDQAYAAFLLAAPLYAVAMAWCVRDAFAAGPAHFRGMGATLFSFTLSYLALSGSLLNPTGLWTRFQLLTGPNSQEWRDYARSADGLVLNLVDLWRAQTDFLWHWSVVALAWSGVLIALVMRGSARARWLRLLPLSLALSSIVCFTLPVARAEHRFVLPSAVWLSVYAGAAVGWLERQGRIAVPLLSCGALGWLLSLVHGLELGLTQLGDARHALTARLSRLPPGSVVEIYGFSVYQPHFDFSADTPYRVERIGKEPAGKRALQPDVQEIVDDYSHFAQRRSAALVVTEGFARNFLRRSFRTGEAASAKWLEAQSDADAVAFFRTLLTRGVPGYRLELMSTAVLPPWAQALGLHPVAVHDSTANRVWLFLRDDVALGVPTGPTTAGASALGALALDR